MSRAVMQQALEALRELSFTDSKITSAKEALAAALAEPEQEPVESISAEQLSKMFQRLEGIDQNQWGYHWRCGWNDALREAMDYCQAAPTQRKPQTTHWEGCEAVHPECKAKTELERKSDAIQRLWKERDELRTLNAELVEALREIEPILARMYGAQYRLYLQPMQIVRGALAKVEASK